MPFDIDAARRDGVTDSQIADYLASRSNFDITQARKDGVADTEIANYLSSRQSVTPKEAPKDTTFGEDVYNNFIHGVESAKDLVNGNFQSIGEYKPTPKTEALADKLFSNGFDDPSLMGIAKAIYKNTGVFNEVPGGAKPSDYSAAILEKFGENAAGKAAAFIGGVVPEFNIVGTAVSRYVNPAISEATGIAPENLQLMELAASPFGYKAAKEYQTPTEYAIRHPVDATIKTISGTSNFIGKTAKPIVKPAIRSILEADNPITGDPGLKTALSSDIAKEGVALEQSIPGLKLTAGEMTGNTRAMGLEDAAANSDRYAEKFAIRRQKNIDAVVNKFNKTLDEIYPQATTRDDAGNRIASAYNSTLNSLLKTRSEQAKIDFNSALEGSKDPYILSNNLFRELQAIKSEGEGKLLTSSDKHAAAVARELLGRVSSKTAKGGVQADMLSIKDMARGLSSFSAESRRQGGILENAQTAAERRVYTRLFRALEADLDAEIASPKGSPERAAQLAQARENFRNLSNQISDIEKTTLGKIVGTADYDSQGNLVISPEKVADRFTAMEATEIKNTLKFLDQNHPDVAQMARRYTLERTLNKAIEGRGQRGTGTTKEFAKAEFVKSLPDDAKLNALLNNPKAATEIHQIASAINRMIDYGAERKGSQTFSRGSFMESIANFGRGALYRSLASDSLVEDLLNPSIRRQILEDAKKINRGSPTKITITPEDKEPLPKVDLPTL